MLSPTKQPRHTKHQTKYQSKHQSKRRVALRLGVPLACAGLLFAAIAPARAMGATPAADASATATASPAKPSKALKGPKSKKKKKAASDAAAAAAAAERRRRIGASPAYVVGDSDAHLINESGPPLEAFPTDSKAVKKAFAETRRDQVDDAEKAARDAKTPDRWRTVLFMLRGLPERSDPEVCFWRVLAFYRLGEIPRARTLRENCDVAGKDSATLNSEDATAAGIPVMGTVTADDGLGQTGAGGANQQPKPAPPTAPYTGPSPQRK